MTSAAPPSASGDGSGSVPVGEMLSPDGALMPHSHDTHLSAAASLGVVMNVGGSVSQTRSGSPPLGAEPEWEWDCRAAMQEGLVPGSAAAQAISLRGDAFVSHSLVGGSALQTHGFVATMRLRGGGWSDEQAGRRHEAEYQLAKERCKEAGAWTDHVLDQIAENMDQLAEGNLAIQRLNQLAEGNLASQRLTGKRDWEGAEAAEGSGGMVREPEVDFKRQRTPTERKKSEASQAAACRAEEGRRATEEVAAGKKGAEADPWSLDGGREGKRNWEGVEGEAERRKRRADRFQSPPQGAEEEGRVAEEVAATKKEAKEVAGSPYQETMKQRMAEWRRWRASSERNTVACRDATVVGSQQGSVGWGGRLPQTETLQSAPQGAEEGCRVAEEVAATKEEAKEVAGTKEGAEMRAAGRAAGKKRRWGEQAAQAAQWRQWVASSERNWVASSGATVGGSQRMSRSASPPAAAHTARFTAAYANGAVRTPSPPARWTTAAWRGARADDHQQGSGEYGGWWGGAQGRGKWGDEQAACNQVPPPPPTPTIIGNWTPPPLRTGWGIECGVRHAEHPLWEPYAVEWHRRGRNGEAQLTWRQFVRWMEAEPEDTTAVVRPVGQHPPPLRVASSPPLPATYSLVPTTTRIAASAAAPAAAAAPVPLAGQLYSQVAAVAAQHKRLGDRAKFQQDKNVAIMKQRDNGEADQILQRAGIKSAAEQLRKQLEGEKEREERAERWDVRRGEKGKAFPQLPSDLWALILKHKKAEREQSKTWAAWADRTLMQLVAIWFRTGGHKNRQWLGNLMGNRGGVSFSTTDAIEDRFRPWCNAILRPGEPNSPLNFTGIQAVPTTFVDVYVHMLAMMNYLGFRDVVARLKSHLRAFARCLQPGSGLPKYIPGPPDSEDEDDGWDALSVPEPGVQPPRPTKKYVNRPSEYAGKTGGRQSHEYRRGS